MAKIWISKEEAEKRGYSNPYNNEMQLGDLPANPWNHQEELSIKSDYIKQQNSREAYNERILAMLPSDINEINPTLGLSKEEQAVIEEYISDTNNSQEIITDFQNYTKDLPVETQDKLNAYSNSDNMSTIVYRAGIDETSTDGKNNDKNIPTVTEKKSDNVEQASDQKDTKPENPETKVIDNTPTELTETGIQTITDLQVKNIVKNLEQKDIWKKKADRNKIVESNKKVSLNVAPINKSNNISNYMSENEWGSRLSYILGDDTTKLLYSHFKDTMGLVFPYTPDIDFNHQVNYEETDILHSNLSVQHYKNTPPPNISLKADFTADTPENGEYMYAVIHFLRSISKCEFGETVAAYSSITGSGSGNREAVPPPTLYLNGWGNLIDNIPVVVKSFGIGLGKDKHYVNVAKYNVWLPTDITISIQMSIQFNLDMYKQLFDLNDYKNMVLFNKDNIVDLKTFSVTNAETNKGVQTTLYKTSTTRRYNGSGWTW